MYRATLFEATNACTLCLMEVAFQVIQRDDLAWNVAGVIEPYSSLLDIPKRTRHNNFKIMNAVYIFQAHTTKGQ